MSYDMVFNVHGTVSVLISVGLKFRGLIKNTTNFNFRGFNFSWAVFPSELTWCIRLLFSYWE